MTSWLADPAPLPGPGGSKLVPLKRRPRPSFPSSPNTPACDVSGLAGPAPSRTHSPALSHGPTGPRLFGSSAPYIPLSPLANPVSL